MSNRSISLRSLAQLVGVDPQVKRLEQMASEAPDSLPRPPALAVTGCLELAKLPLRGASSTGRDLYAVLEPDFVPLRPVFAHAQHEWKQAHVGEPDDPKVALQRITRLRSHNSNVLQLSFKETRYSAVISAKPLIDRALRWDDGSISSPREHFFPLLWKLDESPIPNSFVMHVLIITRDHYLLLARRSDHVAYWPGTWVVGFEEQLEPQDWQSPAPLHACVVRGVWEELGLLQDVSAHAVRVLSIFLEFANLNTGAVAVIHLPASLADIQSQWSRSARDKDEVSLSGLHGIPLASRDVLADIALGRVVSLGDTQVTEPDWHPTARYRVLTFLTHTWGLRRSMSILRERESGV